MDGLRIRPAVVRRSLRLTLATPAAAQRLAADLAALECEARADGATVHVLGSHAVLAQVVGMFTKEKP